MELLKVHTEKIVRETGSKSAVEICGQKKVTKPRLDESGDAVGHGGAFTISKDQQDATLIYSSPPNATIGPSL